MRHCDHLVIRFDGHVVRLRQRKEVGIFRIGANTRNQTPEVSHLPALKRSHQTAYSKHKIPNTANTRWCMTRRKCLASPLSSPKIWWSATSPPSGSPSPCQEGRCSGQLFSILEQSKDNLTAHCFVQKGGTGWVEPMSTCLEAFTTPLPASVALSPQIRSFRHPENYHVKVAWINLFLPSREMTLGLLKATWKTIRKILPTSEKFGASPELEKETQSIRS